MGKVLTLEPSPLAAMVKSILKLYEAGEIDQAMTLVEQGLGDNPNEAQLVNVAAMLLHKAGRTPIAVSLAERACALEPRRPETWSVAGLCHQKLCNFDVAQRYFREALKLQPRENKELYGKALNQLAAVHVEQGRFREGEKWARDSLAQHVEVSAKHNLGLSLLGQRQWAEGWQNYSASVGTEYRRNWKYREPDEPTWDGTKGQKVIVYGEQGIGDEMCFASMIPDAAKDAQVIVDCDKRLEGLFRRSFPDCKVYGTRNQKALAWDKEDRDFDASISMAELGKLYRNSDDAFPGTPYLVPCPIRTKSWKATLKGDRPVIGIAWTGGTKLNKGKFRNAPLDLWQPVFDSVNAHWVNLEYKPADTKGTPLHTYPWATLTKDYDDTAALVAACDLVICMQTSVGHLAGALGVPAWVMVPKQSEWKYGDFDTLPWYRGSKVYHQTSDWAEVLQRIARDLASDRRALAVV